jgi:hypothetical protein
MDNIHTCIIHRLNLVIARVLLMHCEGFQFTGDMISGPLSRGANWDQWAKMMPLLPCGYQGQSLHRTGTNMWPRYAQSSCRLGNVDVIVHRRRKCREREADCWSSHPHPSPRRCTAPASVPSSTSTTVLARAAMRPGRPMTTSGCIGGGVAAAGLPL